MSTLLQEAKKRIAECLKTRSDKLVLKDLGLTDLSDIPKLFECTHLKKLDLHSEILETHKKKNQITHLPLEFGKLKKLDKFITW